MEHTSNLDTNSSIRSMHALRPPLAISGSALLQEAFSRFTETKVDQLLVEDDNGNALGLIDIQDLNG
jgi:CBS domain-containing protein